MFAIKYLYTRHLIYIYIYLVICNKYADFMINVKTYCNSILLEYMHDNWCRCSLCVSKLTITDSDNGLSPDQRQAIIWTNVGMLLIGPPGTNVSEHLMKSYTFPFKKMHLKMSSGEWWSNCPSLNVLTLLLLKLLSWCHDLLCFHSS